MFTKKYAIVGGDLRNLYLAEQLKQDYNRVDVYGFEKAERSKFFKKVTIEKAVEGSNILVAGLPFCDKNGFVNMPLSDEKLELKYLLDILPENALLIAGKIEETAREMLDEKGVIYMDLLQRDEMAVLNAIPTAEGVLQIIMQELPVTIHSCRFLVLGYGRCGKVISRMLKNLGAEVWVEARKYSDLAWIEVYGYHPVHLKKLDRFVSDMDVIINTVPAVILNKNILCKLRSDCLILDISSKPGGVDFEYASKQGIKTIWALGIPGRVAPLTAGKVIKRTIYNFVFERGAGHDS